MGYWCVVPAAGSGSRMKASLPKQYLTIAGQTVIEHTLARLLSCARLEKIVVVIAPEDAWWPEMAIASHPRIVAVTGGDTRAASVRNGLQALEPLADRTDWVLVHDAARPCVRLSDIEKMIGALKHHEVGGLLGVPVADTIKRVGDSGEVLETPDRSRLWRALTPQMFRFALLSEALDRALATGAAITDEASAIELAGKVPQMIAGASDNLKITRPEDLKLAETLLRP